MTATVQYDFNGQRVLASGATSGIGEAAALAFAAAGARVVINGRNRERARAIIESSKSLPGSMAFVSGDIRSSATCDTIVAEAQGILGGLDIVGSRVESRAEDGQAENERRAPGAEACRGRGHGGLPPPCRRPLDPSPIARCDGERASVYPARRHTRRVW